jgi:hypothetical protein
MAAQLRFLVAESVVNADARGALEHIAEQLEGMAGGVVLSGDAAAQIRAALLAQLQHSGGGLAPEDDPDLSAGDRALRPGVRAPTARRDQAAQCRRHAAGRLTRSLHHRGGREAASFLYAQMRLYARKCVF